MKHPWSGKAQEWFSEQVTKRRFVIGGSAVVAAVPTAAFWWFNARGVFELAGFWATVCALSFAVVIYILTAKDTEKTHDKIEALATQIAILTDIGSLDQGQAQAAQAVIELSDPGSSYREYVDALTDEYPLPERAIVSIRRAGEGRGNFPVIIETERGRRYSVWRGGRGGGFTVTKLPPIAESDSVTAWRVPG
ncbi:hypothetical protein C8K36_103474 [Rhodococcus sp. OK519]|uniref:hypothetical protein n=1 Tax=Rhodococcus sp. OK519 TaxID=2135729 RepID=UPI000D4E2ED0|nr:hypothetical protein C8K36_103474 [Rhodococcus sp. OK519]